jgi:hypothetical protein
MESVSLSAVDIISFFPIFIWPLIVSIFALCSSEANATEITNPVQVRYFDSWSFCNISELG